MEKKLKVAIVSGPTATGKTDLAIKAAKEFGYVVINFDSLLFYREINIGTAKPTEEELNEVHHHMVNIRSVKEPINAADYMRETMPLIQEIHKQGKVPLLVGGSGFYLQTILRGMYDSKTTDPKVTDRSDKLYADEGIAPFIEILKEHDQINYEKLHENDHYRIRRAVEHFWSTGTAFSAMKKSHEDRVKESNVHGWDVLHIHLDVPKEDHWKIIERRTARMFDQGIIDEVKELLDQGIDPELKPMKSIGYKETVEYIQGKFESLEDCIEKVVISTRQLAKSQRTWFKHEKDKKTFHPIEDESKILDEFSAFTSL